MSGEKPVNKVEGVSVDLDSNILWRSKDQELLNGRVVVPRNTESPLVNEATKDPTVTEACLEF